MNTVRTLSLPIDKLGWLYRNANRDPGEKDERGNQVRPPAPYIPLTDCLTYQRKGQSLTAKEPENAAWDYTLQGAMANREAWQSWVKSKTETFHPNKEI